VANSFPSRPATAPSLHRLQLRPGWKGASYTHGWGAKTPGRAYEPGAYYANLFVDGDLIAKGEFEVY